MSASNLSKIGSFLHHSFRRDVDRRERERGDFKPGKNALEKALESAFAPPATLAAAWVFLDEEEPRFK